MNSLGFAKSNATYNWSPVVHTERFGEQLYFFLIRLKTPLHRPVATQIHDLLGGVGIQYACEYTLFGSWDALVRVWLTPYRYNKLAQAMTASHTNVDRFEGFTTNRIYYLWSGQDKNFLDDPAILASATTYAKSVEKAALEPDVKDAAVWAELIDNDLVIERDSASSEAVKFHTSLDRPQDQLTVDEELVHIKNALEKADLYDHSSIYVGVGDFAHYIIRSMTNSFHEVLPKVEELDSHLQYTRLRPTTLLVANSTPYESDHINDPSPLSLEENNDAVLLKLASTDRLQALPRAQKLVLHELIQQACETTGNDLATRDELLELLKSALNEDRVRTQSGLNFVLAIEKSFRRFMLALLPSVFGNDWYNAVKVKCESEPAWERHAKDMETPLNKWTIGTFKFTALAGEHFSELFKGKIRTALGEDWDNELERARVLRNRFSHDFVEEGASIAFDEDMAVVLAEAIRVRGLLRKFHTQNIDL